MFALNFKNSVFKLKCAGVNLNLNVLKTSFFFRSVVF